MLKKKSNKTLGIILLFFLGSQMAQADIEPSDSVAFNIVHQIMENADNMNQWLERARNTADSIENELSPEDRESVPDVDAYRRTTTTILLYSPKIWGYSR